MISESSPFQLTGRHVLLALLAFFGTIFAVNGVFLYKALKTHAGVVSVEPYRKGLNYNQRIAAEEEQARLGWSTKLDMTGDGSSIALSLNDKAGFPVSGLAVTASVGRPATASHDVKLALVEERPGVYSGALPAREPGAWIIDISARRLGATADETVFRMRSRKWLKPAN